MSSVRQTKLSIYRTWPLMLYSFRKNAAAFDGICFWPGGDVRLGQLLSKAHVVASSMIASRCTIKMRLCCFKTQMLLKLPSPTGNDKIKRQSSRSLLLWSCETTYEIVIIVIMTTMIPACMPTKVLHIYWEGHERGYEYESTSAIIF